MQDTTQSIHPFEEYQLTLSSSSRTSRLTILHKGGRTAPVSGGHGLRQHGHLGTKRTIHGTLGLASGWKIKLPFKESAQGDVLGESHLLLTFYLAISFSGQYLLSYKRARPSGQLSDV